MREEMMQVSARADGFRPENCLPSKEGAWCIYTMAATDCMAS
jgi:hypothetical protein